MLPRSGYFVRNVITLEQIFLNIRRFDPSADGLKRRTFHKNMVQSKWFFFYKILKYTLILYGLHSYKIMFKILAYQVSMGIIFIT